jgi:anti-anti-sigma factor
MDLATVGELRHMMWSASRGGALALVLDLTDVTHLGSAGIQLLYEFAEQTTAEGQRPTLIVPPRCPAELPVRITGLDQVVTVVAAR